MAPVYATDMDSSRRRRRIHSRLLDPESSRRLTVIPLGPTRALYLSLFAVFGPLEGYEH